MARRGRRSSQQRDTTDITSPDLGLLLAPVPRPLSPLPVLPGVPDLELEDRRRFTFESPQVAIRSPGTRASVRMVPVGLPAGKTRQRASLPRELPSFRSPSQVMVCVRRKSRREVLFALKRTGKGGRSRRRRRNEFTSVRC